MVAGCGGMATAHETTAVHALTGASSRGLYLVTCTPPDGSVRLGQPQTWTVLVTTRAGAPVSHLRLGVQHRDAADEYGAGAGPQRHGGRAGALPRRGVEFTMGGRWMMVVTLAGPARTGSRPRDLLIASRVESSLRYWRSAGELGIRQSSVE